MRACRWGHEGGAGSCGRAGPGERFDGEAEPLREIGTGVETRRAPVIARPTMTSSAAPVLPRPTVAK